MRHIKTWLLLGLFLSFSVVIQAKDPTSVSQGKTFAVYVRDAKKAEAAFLGKEIKLYPSGDLLRGIIGNMPETRSGIYNLRLKILNLNGKTEVLTKEVKIGTGIFRKASFWLKPSKDKLRTRRIIDKEWAEIEKVLVWESGQQLWEGPFKLPVEGKISMPFGAREYINKRRAGRHRGVDIVNIAGTKIFAPNHGRVVLAKYFKAFGGTIVLDHGQGINTLYFHLSKTLVSAGQAVQKGQLMGRMGSTGISTAPHLHWGMSVHNIRVDPMQWTREIF